MGPFSLGVNSQLEEGTQHCRWLHCAQRESLSRAWAPLAGPRWQLQATCTVPEYLRAFQDMSLDWKASWAMLGSSKEGPLPLPPGILDRHLGVLRSIPAMSQHEVNRSTGSCPWPWSRQGWEALREKKWSRGNSGTGTFPVVLHVVWGQRVTVKGQVAYGPAVGEGFVFSLVGWILWPLMG